MALITHVAHDGARNEIEVPLGHTVMEGARDAGIYGIVAECGGACSCSTCHVYVAPQWIDRPRQKAEMEEDMLDFAPGVDPQRSRLSCQLRVTADMDGLVVTVPEEQA
jgi:2Fe-2S ferredoxin